MPHHNLQKPLQSPPPLLDHGVVETVEVDFAGKGRYADARGLALEQVAEDFEVGVAAADLGAAELEGGDVGAEADEVGGVAGAGGGGGLVGLGVCYLVEEEVVGQRGYWLGRVGEHYFDLEKVLGYAVDFFEALGVCLAACVCEAGGEIEVPFAFLLLRLLLILRLPGWRRVDGAGFDALHCRSMRVL